MTVVKLYFKTLLLLSVIISSCGSFDNSSKEQIEIIRSYHSNGKVKAEMPMENGKRHGLAKSYYPDGTIWQEVNYYKGYKHGTARTFYQTGFLYQESEYNEGRIHGVRKSYRRNGNLMAEIPYFDGKPAAGLKEYFVNGEEKKIYPAIQVVPVMDGENYRLQFSLSDRVKNVEFYFGALDEYGQIPSGANRILSSEHGIPEISFPMEGERKVNETFMVMARATTVLGNPYITEQVHQIIIN